MARDWGRQRRRGRERPPTGLKEFQPHLGRERQPTEGFWIDGDDLAALRNSQQRSEQKGPDEIGALLDGCNDIFDQLIAPELVSRPPHLAERLVAICVGRGARHSRGKALAEATLEDLQDLFERDCEKIGPKRAALRYWRAALRSSWPFIRAGFGRLMTGAGLLKVGTGIWKWWSGG
jgi:hypothetical protein